MAGDWIKVRLMLPKDPKVLKMANHLADDRDFVRWLVPGGRARGNAHRYVTSHVTVAVTVTALSQIWGVARTDGAQCGDDLIVPGCCPQTLDAIAQVPGFGRAMVAARWAVPRDDGSMLFPKFFAVNESTDSMRRKQDAERKRRQRQRARAASGQNGAAAASRDGHADGHVTSHIEKRREEDQEPPNPRRAGGRLTRAEKKAAAETARQQLEPQRRWWLGLPVLERERIAQACGWPAGVNVYAAPSAARLAEALAAHRGAAAVNQEA